MLTLFVAVAGLLMLWQKPTWRRFWIFAAAVGLVVALGLALSEGIYAWAPPAVRDAMNAPFGLSSVVANALVLVFFAGLGADIVRHRKQGPR
jgi:hypothetical protein